MGKERKLRNSFSDEQRYNNCKQNNSKPNSPHIKKILYHGQIGFTPGCKAIPTYENQLT
jgi:hypothetical protein